RSRRLSPRHLRAHRRRARVRLERGGAEPLRAVRRVPRLHLRRQQHPRLVSRRQHPRDADALSQAARADRGAARRARRQGAEPAVDELGAVDLRASRPGRPRQAGDGRGDHAVRLPTDDRRCLPRDRHCARLEERSADRRAEVSEAVPEDPMSIDKNGQADPSVKPPSSGPDEATVHGKSSSSVLTDIPAVIAADLRVDVGASGEERPPRARTLTPTPPPGVAGSGGHEVQSIDVAAGTRIGQYEIIRELGSGGMGTVCLARDLRLGRRVAIKFLQSKNQDMTRRFILEARATATCSHENIVSTYEVGHYKGNPFMVLEFLNGQPMSDVAKKDMKLPPARAVELMLPVVRALVCAHEKGIVHRDLKPDNVFVTESGS